MNNVIIERFIRQDIGTIEPYSIQVADRGNIYFLVYQGYDIIEYSSKDKSLTLILLSHAWPELNDLLLYLYVHKIFTNRYYFYEADRDIYYMQLHKADSQMLIADGTVIRCNHGDRIVFNHVNNLQEKNKEWCVNLLGMEQIENIVLNFSDVLGV